MLRLRKLDSKEVNLIKRGWGQNMVMKLRIKSEIDLFDKANLDVVKKSIKIWMKSQVFLRSKISKTPSTNDEYFFEYSNDDFDCSNLKLLRATDNRLGDREMISRLLFDYILSNEIDPDKESNCLLWKLYIFEIDCNVYDFIAIFHHSITQGKTGFLNLCELLRTIDYVHKNEPIDLKEGSVFPGCASASLFDFALGYNSSVSTPVCKVPSFVDPKKAKENSLNSLIVSDFESEIFYVDSGLRFETSLDDLFQISRVNFIKYEELNLDEDLFSRLLGRCKKEGAKLTGCLEVVICVCLKKLYEKLGASEDEIASIVYFTVISLRGAAKLDEETMGLCTGGLITLADMNDINGLSRSENNIDAKFWPIAKRWSDRLHERLNVDESRFFPKSKALSSSDEINYHFILSNLGDLGKTKFGYFDIQDALCMTTFGSHATMRLFVNYLMTNQNGKRLKWVVMYHSHFVDVSIVKNLIGLYLSLLNDIVKKL